MFGSLLRPVTYFFRVAVARNSEALAALVLCLATASAAILIDRQRSSSSDILDLASGNERLLWDSTAVDEVTAELASTYLDQLDLAYIDPELPADIAITLVPPSSVVPEEAWREYVIKRRDTLGSILNHITEDQEASSFLVSQKLNAYRRLKIGSTIEYRNDDQGRLTALRYKVSPDLVLEFERDANLAMKAVERVPVLTTKLRSKQGSITRKINSLFGASDKAGVPDLVIQTMIVALETRIDFQRETRIGDHFTLVYEELLDENGAFARVGRLLGFNWHGARRVVTALRDPTSNAFYESDGTSLQQAFLRSPVKFTRISSRFSKSRFHPILKKWRAHKGVDFAAPSGTPVRAAGDGIITFVGRKGGYGNMIIIRHFGKYDTIYGHLQKFARKSKRNAAAVQGQIIGYVGSSGLATGPHLHYEFRVSNVHKDPLSTSVPTAKPPLSGAKLASFQAATASIKDTLAGTIQFPAAASRVQ